MGVGKGMSMPADRKYLGRYEAISESKIWCGNKKSPRGKVNGTNPQCFQKGFGIGSKKKALEEFRRRPRMGFGTDVDLLRIKIGRALEIVSVLQGDAQGDDLPA